jgi:hypothetical protein
MTTASWGVGRRVGFRFGFVVAALVLFPFPLDLIPKTEWLGKLVHAPWDWLVVWFAETVLGLPAPSTVQNGSGDTTADYVMWLVVIILAALGTAIWSALDRRRTAYPRLATAIWILIRYYLAYTMLSYGFAKILKSQFPDLPPGRLVERVGEVSPMGMLWMFMGYSTPYTVFAGLAEAIGGVLLFWRRTMTLGAALIAIVMTNVVILNFCYDVPVKLYSSELLIMAIVVGHAGLRRIIAAALGHAVPAVLPRARMSLRRERLRLAVKLVVIGLMATTLYLSFSGRASRNAQVHELYGLWTVDSFSIDGVEQPPLATDKGRWQRVAGNPRALWIVNVADERAAYKLEVDAPKHTLTVKLYDKDYNEVGSAETWTYARPAPDHLVIDGPHLSKQLHVTLHREPEPPLLARGFHWINESPYNR